LRRSELVGLDVEHVTWIGNGLKLLIERSKTDAQGEGAEITIPRGRADDTCPITALKTWLELSEITTGPVFRKVNRGGVVERARLATDAVRQLLLKRAAKAGLKGTLAEPFTPHGLRAGFVTTAYRNGVPDEEIMGHTRHRSLTTMRSYATFDAPSSAARARQANWDFRMALCRNGRDEARLLRSSSHWDVRS
jgi:integrase